MDFFLNYIMQTILKVVPEAIIKPRIVYIMRLKPTEMNENKL